MGLSGKQLKAVWQLGREASGNGLDRRVLMKRKEVILEWKGNAKSLEGPFPKDPMTVTSF